MSSPSLQRRWSAETRFCVIFFGVALIINVALSSIGWGNNLLGRYEFRQVQTAITAHFFLTDGVKLDYETPLLGPPWEMPLEFPAFQACVAWFVRATGLPLDAAGGLVSWLFFISALPACYLLLGRFQVLPARRLLFLALLLLSPIYIYFSRSFLIESTVVAFSCWFLYFFSQFLDRPRLHWLLAASGCGAAAGMIKVTTLAVFLMAALLLLVAALRSRGQGKALHLWLRAAVGVAVPIAASVWWVFHTSAVRAHNPEAYFLDSHFGYWSFGDLALRLSPGFWLRTFRVWSDEILSEAALAFIVLYYGWLRGRYCWVVTGCLAAFLSGQLIFANLYMVHDYYFYGSGVFLIAALGFCLLELLDQPTIPLSTRWAFIATVLGFQISAYHRSLYEIQKTETEVPEYVEFIKSITAPDETIVVLGYDWDATVPYYAQRRALMLLRGREHAPDAIRTTIARLDPQKVGAVLIRGHEWQDAAFVKNAMESLPLGPRPLFFNESLSVGIWVPEDRQALLRDQWDRRRFPSIDIAFEQNTTGKPVTIYARKISQRAEFEDFSPRPIRATALNDFTAAVVDGTKVLNAHATTEIVFRPRPGATRITGIYGLPHEAVARPGMSDGVEFVIVQIRPDGTEHPIFRRVLDPEHNPADRGIQQLDVSLPSDSSAEICLRALPGPSGNASFDWSYVGQLKIE